jgi:hypothetical protein
VVRNFNAVELSGNGNGIIEPGEHATLKIELRNMGLKKTMNKISVSLAAKSAGLSMITNKANYSDLKPFHNTSRNFDFVLTNSTPQNKTIQFELTIRAEGTILRKEIVKLNH